MNDQTFHSKIAIKIGDTMIVASTTQSGSENHDVPNLVRETAEGLERFDDGVAGQWTHCIAWLSTYPGQMNVRNAIDGDDGFRRALLCRNDVTSTTYYSNPVIINAPFIICDK